MTSSESEASISALYPQSCAFTPTSRTHIIERYLQLQLAEYRRIFRSTDEAGQLDNVPRRYAWFRRLLKHHDEEDADIFPASWGLTRMLVTNFAEYTRADLSNVLGKQTPQIGTLLEALQATLDFEGAMGKRFEMSVSGRVLWEGKGWRQAKVGIDASARADA